MGLAEILSFALAVGGTGISVAVFFATYVWRDMKRWVAICGFCFGLILCLCAIGSLLFFPHQSRPEVSASFVDVAHPLLQFDNVSEASAQNIKWEVLIWNLNHPEQHQPLPIPTDAFDFLPANSSSAPLILFSRPGIAPAVRDGDVLFGSLSVNCPQCARGWTYWIFIRYGHGGWYAPVHDITNGNIVHIANSPWLTAMAADVIRTIPQEQRIEIRNVPHVIDDTHSISSSLKP